MLPLSLLARRRGCNRLTTLRRRLHCWRTDPRIPRYTYTPRTGRFSQDDTQEAVSRPLKNPLRRLSGPSILECGRTVWNGVFPEILLLTLGQEMFEYSNDVVLILLFVYSQRLKFIRVFVIYSISCCNHNFKFFRIIILKAWPSNCNVWWIVRKC